MARVQDHSHFQQTVSIILMAYGALISMVSPKFPHLLMDGFKFMFSEFRETPVIFWVALKKLPYMTAKEMNFWSNVEIIWTITCQFQVCISKILDCLLPAWLPDQTKAGVFHNRIGIEDVNELPACFS